jgi:hypothetical protein
MSNIDKQAVQAVADLKAGYTLGRADVAILNELARIALASLEAEAVAYVRSAHNPDGFCFADGIHPTHRHQRLPLSTLQDGCYWKVTPLYAAPPAPVSVPDEIEPTAEAIKRILPTSNPDDYAACIGADMWNACRAAMLQGAENAESRCTIQTAPALDSLPKNAELRCSNSPVIPDGWVLVPKEPTPDMLNAAWVSHGIYHASAYRTMLAAAPQQVK